MPQADRDRERHRLQAELARAEAELAEHLASWEYAFAMGSGRHGANQHPVHWETHRRTASLSARRSALRARLSEFEI